MHLYIAGYCIGIDLGTTYFIYSLSLQCRYSCVGVWREGKVEIIPNDLGNRTTPSVVAFTDTHRLIGEAAKAQITSNPTNTVFDAKRLIGRKYSEPLVQNDLKHWPFTIIPDETDKPIIEVEYLGETKQFTCGMYM